MTKPDALLMFDAARDNLAESMRYVLSSPSAAAGLVSSAVEAIEALLPNNTGDRLVLNLTVALRSTLVDPDVFRGYVYGVRHELLTLRDALERSE